MAKDGEISAVCVTRAQRIYTRNVTDEAEEE